MKRLLYTCFFLSGAAGLLYEIYWAQRFSLLLGVDVYSHAAVLTAFMGGLALGSHILGRRADRFARPLGVYILLELGIAAFGLLVPVALLLVTGPMRWMYTLTDGQPQAMTWFRVLIALIVLIVPTALMGGTLPVMTRVLRQQADRLGVVVGRLYAVNTIGAVVGILAGGFILSEWIGLMGTNFVAIALNLSAAGLAFKMLKSPAFAAGGDVAEGAFVLDPPAAVDEEEESKGKEEAEEKQVPTETAPQAWTYNSSPRVSTLIAVCAGLTGAAAMITQIGWIRTITLMIGSSSYAFSLVVAVFLIGLSLGAWLAVKLVRWWSDAAVPWAFSCLLTAVFSWITMWALGGSPDVVLSVLTSLTERESSILRIYLFLGLLTFLVLGPPTIMLGMTFPLACETYAQRFSRGTARITGALYAVNTVGAMLGSALGGLVLIGLFGIQGSLNAAAALYLVAGLIIATVANPTERKRFPGVIGLTTCGVAAAIVGSLSWSPKTLLSAPYAVEADYAPQELLYYKEAPEATVAVERQDLGDGVINIVLLINGKPDASTTGDVGTQVLLGQVPMLLHGNARDVNVIGLGAGVTLASVLTHPVESVDMVEISQAVVEAIRPADGSPGPFDYVNRRSLDDPRVRLIIGDGRNHLALTDRKYDVIISEPSNPWFAGVASLFTREFFQSCRDRLNDDGVLCQWLQGYQMPSEEFFRVVRTMGGVFGSVTVWACTPPAADYLVIATPQARPVLDSIAELMQQPTIRDDLARIAIKQPAHLFGLCILDAADLDSIEGVGAFSQLADNTDDWNKLAFKSIRALWRPELYSLSDQLWQRRTLPVSWTGPLEFDNPTHQPLIRGIQDLQDTMPLVILWDDTLAAPYGKAIRRLNASWLGHDVFLDEFKEHSTHSHQPTPEELKRTGARIARESLAQITDQSNAIDNQRAARRARVQALVALVADSQDADNGVLLAEALWRMGRMNDARAALRWAVAKSAAVRPELMEALLPEVESPAPTSP